MPAFVTRDEFRTFARSVEARFDRSNEEQRAMRGLLESTNETQRVMGVLLERIDSKVTALAEGQAALRAELELERRAGIRETDLEKGKG